MEQLVWLDNWLLDRFRAEQLRLLKFRARGPLLNGAITTLLLTGAQLGLVRYLFQLHQRGTPAADPR